MMTSRCNHQRGAILLSLLVMVVIVGLLAGLAGQSWRSTMQREREAELLWKGLQYRQAIASYHRLGQTFPSDLEELLRDPRAPGVIRHLRKLYDDPMTGDSWVLIRTPDQKIVGVRSSSEEEPFRQDGFPEELEGFRGKSTYSEWEFTFVPSKAKQADAAPSPVTAPDGAVQ